MALDIGLFYCVSSSPLPFALVRQSIVVFGLRNMARRALSSGEAILLNILKDLISVQKPDLDSSVFVLGNIGVISCADTPSQLRIGVQANGPYGRYDLPHAAAEEALPLSLLQPFQRDRVQALPNK